MIYPYQPKPFYDSIQDILCLPDLLIPKAVAWFSLSDVKMFCF